MKRSKLSWKPIWKGKTFCSPACGYGCTRAAYKQAWLDAKELASQLGWEWRTRVWENMGWHYEVVSASGCWKVSPLIHRGKVTGYSAYLGKSGSPGGLWCNHARTPFAAIEKVRRRALATIDCYQRMLDACRTEGLRPKRRRDNGR